MWIVTIFRMFRRLYGCRGVWTVIVIQFGIVFYLWAELSFTTESAVSKQHLHIMFENRSVTSNRTNVSSSANGKETIPIVYVITPTKFRHEQVADLTRLSHTLSLVPRLHWILIEDSRTDTERVTGFVARARNILEGGITHLSLRSTKHDKLKGRLKRPPIFQFTKGCEQRNLGLDWITENGEFPCVFYFADDDNTYDLRLFEEMRKTKKVSVLPVGLAAALYESPLVKNGKIVGWVSGWGNSGRQYQTDMAGFSVNCDTLRLPNPPRFDLKSPRGHAESDFLSQIVNSTSELEPRADNCTKILVWHTKTVANLQRMVKIDMLQKLTSKYNTSFIGE